ncbi:8981_t:CDS:2 [Cetraspora pellucida]|uniref:8981_t:CDS:1 n=1 Tax=Cetraspora pellucida TaxID=1433469 RepID=A0ACA9KMN8_9GLOM|nr:8981_t:CDS:2 [Cetraspora pellucida]
MPPRATRKRHNSNITQKKRRSWNVREKLAILAFLENHPQKSIRATATMFNIEPVQVRKWRGLKQQLMEAAPHILRLNNSTRPKYPELEGELNEWVKNLRKNLKVVTRSMIQMKAKALAKTERFCNMYPDIKECKFSSKWIDGFMVHYKFSHRRRTTVAQKLPEDLHELQHSFLGFVLYRRIQYDYPLKFIGNMDETPISFDLPSQTTIEETGAKTVSIRTCGYEKSTFTVILGCMADGTKLPAMVIFKLMNVPRQVFPPGIIIRANKEGYSNTDETFFWIENIWQKRASLSSNPQKNANNVGNYVYLSNENIDTNESTNSEVENIETYFRNEENEENRISVREYEDDYYEIEEINYINEWV